MKYGLYFIDIKTASAGALLLALLLWGQSAISQDATYQRVSAGQIKIPDRALTSPFKGEQGKQRTEIHFDPSTGVVQIKLLVQDPLGNFIPNIRRENFVVYENGVRQTNASVDVEHAPVSVALLVELGGRYPGLNRALAEQASLAGRQLLEVLGQEDKIAVWKYADKPELLADFSKDRENVKQLFYTLQPPGVSEANLYDALIAVWDRMRPVAGRKAIVLLSSGLDTFSKAKYEDVLRSLQGADTPVYAIGLGAILRGIADLPGTVTPAARFDWKRAEKELMAIARTSGGRFYSPTTGIDISAAYDDIMENLKVRYVIQYKSSTSGDANRARTVRVELVDPKTGGPLQIVDASGRTVRAHVVVQDSYTPGKAQEP